MEKDYLEVYLKEYGFDHCKVNFIPNIHSLGCLMHKFLFRLKENNIKSLMKLSNDYKEFHISLSEIMKNNLPFFKVNPIYDFLKFGFLELFQPKKWNLKIKLDFTSLENLNEDQKYSVLLESLVDKIENTLDID